MAMPLTRGILAQTGYQGAIAQLGERYNGIVEVSGSIPLSSTNFFISRSKSECQCSSEPITLWLRRCLLPRWACAGILGKLDGVRQLRRQRFQGAQ